MFEKFTTQAIEVIIFAQQEARRSGHNAVGTEQILLGLIGIETSIAAKSLKAAGLDLKSTREEVEALIGKGSGFTAVEIPFTPNTKQLIEFAEDESKQLGINYIDTEHLLLGLIRVQKSSANKVLEIFNIDSSKLRHHVLESIPAIDAFYKPVKKNNVDSAANATISTLIRALPPAAQNVARELVEICQEKELAIQGQEFEKAAHLREQEHKLSTQLRELITI